MEKTRGVAGTQSCSMSIQDACVQQQQQQLFWPDFDSCTSVKRQCAPFFFSPQGDFSDRRFVRLYTVEVCGVRTLRFFLVCGNLGWWGWCEKEGRG